MSKWIYMTFGAAALILVSCNKVENSEIDQLLKEEAKNMTKPGTTKPSTSVPKVDEKKVPETTSKSPDGSRSPGSNDPKLEEIRKMMKVGNYDGIIALVGNSDNFHLRYYAAMSWYAKMLMKSRFSAADRQVFQGKALTLLKQIGNEAPDDLLKARGLLWYGYGLHVSYENFTKNKEAIDVFYQIQTSSLKETDVYDDSLLYTAKVYYKMGWYIQAREFYKKLATEKSKDNQVYDPDLNKFFTPKEASAMGLERIRQISLAGLRDKEAAGRRSQPAASTSSGSSSSTSSSTSSTTSPNSSSGTGTTSSSSSSSTTNTASTSTAGGESSSTNTSSTPSGSGEGSTSTASSSTNSQPTDTTASGTGSSNTNSSATTTSSSSTNSSATPSETPPQ